MQQKKLPISKSPIFHKYIYEYLKNNTNENISFKTIKKDFYIYAYSQNTLTMNATILIKSSIIDKSIIGLIHIDNNSVLQELKETIKELWDLKLLKLDFIFFGININMSKVI